MKRNVLIFLSFFILLGCVYLFSRNKAEPIKDETGQLLTSLATELIRHDASSLPMVFDNPDTGISLEYNENVRIIEGKADMCTFPTELSYCLTIMTNNSLNMKILIIDNTDGIIEESGKIHLDESQISNSVLVETSEFVFIRPNDFDAPIYNNEHTNVMIHFEPDSMFCP